MARYLVTGAAGFLGRHVVQRLAADGHVVRAMVQRETDAMRGHAPRESFVVADLLDPASLGAAVEGIDIVCHCAAKLPGKSSPDDVWAVNVVGTANLVAAAVEAAVRRLVYVSTDSVYGDAAMSGATEDAPLCPGYIHEGNYPLAKLEGERLVVRAGREHGLEYVIVRTCFMYGPGPSSGSDVLRRLAAKRVHPVFDGGKSRLSLAFVTDVAAAVALAAERPAAAGRTYNVSSGEPHAIRDIVAAIGEVTGRRPWLLSLPGRHVLPWAPLMQRLTMRAVPRLADALDPGKIRFAMADHAIDIGRIRRDLGYVPRVSLREGLRQTLAVATEDSAAVATGHR